jgi:hypothetical protein
MTKFLRKYNKWLIAGFGSFLVLTWLVTGPGAFQADPRKRVVATVGGEKLRAEEVGASELEFAALSEIVPGVIKGAAGVEDAVHWLLLVREAERGGFVGEAGDGANWGQELVSTETEFQVRSDPSTAQFAQFLLQQPSMRAQYEQNVSNAIAQNKQRMSAETRLSITQLDKGLARLRGVFRMINTFQGAGRLSDLRLVQALEKSATRVSFDAVMIPAGSVTGAAVPTEETLTSLFEQYKNTPKGTGETGMGYQLPKRVKAEWMVISKAAVESAVVLDPVDVNKHYLQNRATFTGDLVTERTKVEGALRAARVDAVFSEVERLMRARVRASTRGLEVSGGAKKLTSDWNVRRPRLEDLATGLMNDITLVTLPRPVVVVKAADFIPITSFTDATAIAGPDGAGAQLASAQFTVGTDSGNAAQLLAELYEFNVSNRVGLQVGIPLEAPLVTPEGDRVFLTVIEAAKESPAESLEQVRTQVMADAVRLAAFEKLKSDQNALLMTAAGEGIEALAKQFGSGGVDLAINRRVVISRLNGDSGHPQYNLQSLRDQVVDQVEVLGIATRPSAENLALRTLAVPVISSQSLAVITITGWQPISIEMMRTSGLRSAANVAAMELREIATKGDENANLNAVNPYSLENLKSRLQFISLDRPEPAVKQTPSETTTPTTDPSATQPTSSSAG